MGKSKRKSKGSRGSKGSKGKKGKKGKKKGSKKKVEEKEEPPPPPELNTFVYIRRKNLTLCLETFEEQTVKELKVQVATILRTFPEDITLFALLGKKEEEMEEKEKPKKEEPKKKEERSNSKGRRGSKGSKGSKGKPERSASPPKPPGDMTIGGYGYNPKKSSVFSPATIGLSYRGDDGEFEMLDIEPYGEFPVIPEEVKMHLRNYVPPPPPAKKSGNANNSKNNTNAKKQ